MSPEEQKLKDTRLSVFQRNYDEIKEVLQLDHQVRRYAMEESFKVMEKFGYEPHSTYFSGRDRHFLKAEEHIPDYFRFYFWYPTLVEQGELYVCFGLNNEYSRYGEKLYESKELKALLDTYPAANLDPKSRGGFSRLILFTDATFKDFNAEKTLADHLYQAMDQTFFDKQKGLLWGCTRILEEIIKSENGTTNA